MISRRGGGAIQCPPGSSAWAGGGRRASACSCTGASIRQLGGVWQGQPVRGYAEHIQRIRKIPIPVYREQVAGRFNPTGFDADAWIAAAKRAGMGYFIITAKHHDGFAMYDSAVSDYDVVDATPWKRDPMLELKRGLRPPRAEVRLLLLARLRLGRGRRRRQRLGIPEPGRRSRTARRPRLVDEQPAVAAPGAPLRRRQGHPPAARADREVRSRHPVVRHAPQAAARGEPAHPAGGARRQADDGGQRADRAGDARRRRPRASATTAPPPIAPRSSPRWRATGRASPPPTSPTAGTRPIARTSRPAHFIELLAKAAARGGNVLLNVGPMGDGRIDPEGPGHPGRRRRLDEAATRRRSSAPSARRCRCRPGANPPARATRLYLHVLRWPVGGKLVVGGLRTPVSRAYLLADPSRARAAGDPRRPSWTWSSPCPRRRPTPSTPWWPSSWTVSHRWIRARRLSTELPAETLRAFDGQLVGGLAFGAGKVRDAWVHRWTSTDQPGALAGAPHPAKRRTTSPSRTTRPPPRPAVRSW